MKILNYRNLSHFSIVTIKFQFAWKSLFDNGGIQGTPNENVARGLILDLDMATMTASVAVQYNATFGTISGSQGSQSVGGFLRTGCSRLDVVSSDLEE